mgnify:CR=1 FL=1
MEMKRCESSSNIAAHGYDAATKELRVEFKNGGLYRYADVPVDVAYEFMNAESVGRHFHAHIRHNYTGIRVVPDDILAAG